MRIYSDTLDVADLHEAARRVNDDYPGCVVYVSDDAKLVDKRVRRIERAKLRSHRGIYHSNTGDHGAGSEMAASWTEWGWWLAYLFAWDPAMRAGEYASVDDFHRKTGNRFIDTRTPRQRQVARELGRRRAVM